ncbi:MAG: L-fucose/L-arabinose isomerase family protein [Clostridia bacterium]|jgi:L-fucose isomerase-like protein
MEKMTFALYFGNRGFFPESLIAGARREMKEAVEQLGYHTLMMDEKATRTGGVENAEEGRKYAAFLEAHRGEYDGVILCLPNFGDENGAIAALRDCGVPILIQAYPDEIGKMDFEHRRDAYCGKFSIMDVFYQYNLPFTVFKPHVIHPTTEAFKKQLLDFAAVCRIVKRMRRFTVGAIGARTTAFKTVRFDELTLQKYEITTEALDLSELFMRVRDIKEGTDKFAQKKERLLNYTNWTGVPEEKIDMLTKVSVAIDEIIDDYKLDALALRCWEEMELELGVSPCVLLSELNDRGIVAACELDVGNAVAMYTLTAASEMPATVLDWNNNYGEDEDKCILFHCGPVPQTLMEEKGLVVEHKMFAKSYGAGCGWGCNAGRIAASPMTFASAKTEDGRLKFYLGEGRFTGEPIEEEFFGCGGVAEIENLQDKLIAIGKNGYRHHVGVTFGHVAEAVREAFTTYLGYDLMDI